MRSCVDSLASSGTAAVVSLKSLANRGTRPSLPWGLAAASYPLDVDTFLQNWRHFVQPGDCSAHALPSLLKLLAALV